MISVRDDFYNVVYFLLRDQIQPQVDAHLLGKLDSLIEVTIQRNFTNQFSRLETELRNSI